MKAKRIGKAFARRCRSDDSCAAVALRALASDVTLTSRRPGVVNRNSNIDDELIQKFMDETGIQIDLSIRTPVYERDLDELSTGEVPDLS